MNRAEFLESVELYAVLALSPEEMRACDLFLRESADEECRTALRRAQRTWAAVGTSIDPVKPDEQIWKNIEATLRGSSEAPSARAASRTRERIAWAIAACALITAALIEGRRGAAVDRAVRAESTASQSARLATDAAAASETVLRNEKSEREACSRALETARGESAAKALALAILQTPNSRVLKLAPQGASLARATALFDLAGHRAALVASALPSAAAKEYELWIVRGNDKIPAGLFRPDASGSSVLALDRNLLAGKIDAVAITLEPAGGSPQPTGSILLVAALKG